MNRVSHFTASLLGPVGRTLIAWGFITSGVAKLISPVATTAYMLSGGLPDSSALAIAVGVFEIVAGAALVAGFKIRCVAALLAAFTAMASLMFHPYWALPSMEQAAQQILFTKNVAIFGGLLLVAAMGGGPWSIDARASRRDFTSRLGYPPATPRRPGAVPWAAAKRRAR